MDDPLIRKSASEDTKLLQFRKVGGRILLKAALILISILELDLFLGLEGTSVLLIGLDLLEQLSILGLDVPGSIEGLIGLEVQSVIGVAGAAHAGGFASVHMGQVEPLCDGRPHASIECG